MRVTREAFMQSACTTCFLACCVVCTASRVQLLRSLSPFFAEDIQSILMLFKNLDADTRPTVVSSGHDYVGK